MANRNYSHKKECCLGFFVIQKEIGKDDVLVFTINNSNATNVELSDPECLSNTFLELRDSSNKIIPGAFIKPIYQVQRLSLTSCTISSADCLSRR